MGEAAHKLDGEKTEYTGKFNKDGSPRKKLGGARAGSGRKRKIQKLSNYDKSLKLLDEALPLAMKVVMEALQDTDKTQRRWGADLVLRKTLPDEIDLNKTAFKDVSKELMNGLNDTQLLQLISKEEKANKKANKK